VGEVYHAPGPEALEYGPKRSSVRRHLISNSDPRLGCRASDDEVIRFKLPQLLPKHLGRYSSHGASKFTQPEGSLVQAMENHWLPAAFHDLNCRV